MAFEWLQDVAPYAGAGVGFALGGPAGAALGYGGGTLLANSGLLGETDADKVRKAQEDKQRALAEIQARYREMKPQMIGRTQAYGQQRLNQYQGAADALATMWGKPAGPSPQRLPNGPARNAPMTNAGRLPGVAPTGMGGRQVAPALGGPRPPQQTQSPVSPRGTFGEPMARPMAQRPGAMPGMPTYDPFQQIPPGQRSPWDPSAGGMGY